ncbi:MAG: STAS-like domain-containing protein [Candidatus Dormibacteria bacterium]
MDSKSVRWVRIGDLAASLGVSVSLVRKLADAGRLPHRTTAGGHRLFDEEQAAAAFAHRREGLPLTRVLPLDGLREDEVWRQLLDDAPTRGATRQALRIAPYAFTEMLNNAIDHSGGSHATVTWWPGPGTLRARIADDGIGAFETVRSDRGLPDHQAALAELTKGKVTTQPERHSGEGLFFTSRAVDHFDLRANGLRWTVDNRRGDFAFGAIPVERGTIVEFEIDARTERKLEEVFASYTDEDYGFVRTAIRVRLFESGSDFVSRSEAKRLLSGLEKFKEVELDFDRVESVGQGFADQVLRVWPRQHPGVEVQPVNMNAGVELMMRRVGSPSQAH